MSLKVVIVGQGPRSFEHPNDHEVWVINGPNMPPRWDRLFQLHGPEHIKTKHAKDGVWDLMKRAPRLVTTPAVAKLIPGAEVFPLNASIGGLAPIWPIYLTNSFAAAIALAVHEQAERIVLDGLMIPQGTGQWDAGESWIGPCIEYHLGRASALGIEVVVAPGCGLFRQGEFVYGFEGPGSI